MKSGLKVDKVIPYLYGTQVLETKGRAFEGKYRQRISGGYE